MAIMAGLAYWHGVVSGRALAAAREAGRQEIYADIREQQAARAEAEREALIRAQTEAVTRATERQTRAEAAEPVIKEIAAHAPACVFDAAVADRINSLRR